MKSFLAAEAAACAKDQGKYWEFHNRIYEVQAGENVGTYIPENLKKLAVGLGLNAEQFNQCLDSHKTKSLVETSYDSAVGYGVEATPTVFINGKKLEGLPKYPTVKKLIEEELGK
jgi:protein-disulfide isomerase